MNDDPIKGLSEEELARHIESLEQQVWLKDLQGLQPQTDSQAIYNIGFAAGQALQRPATQVVSLRSAALSSLVSVAATVLIMLQLSPSVQRPAVEQAAVSVVQPDEPQGERSTTQSDSQRQNEIASDAEVIDLDALLAARLPESPKVTFGIDTNDDLSIGKGQATIANERIRYGTQRRDWLNELQN